MEKGTSIEPPAKAPRAVHLEDLTNAQDANAREHELTFLQAIKLYPKGVWWSVVMSTALVMEGFDTRLIGSFFAQPAFQRAYGETKDGKSYQVSAAWQAGLNNGSGVGQVVGLLLAGYVSEKFGFRRTMIGGLVVLAGLVLVQFFSSSLPVLEVGQILVGIPLGLFQTLAIVYAVEVSPTCLRAHLTTYINMCWIIGQIIATGTLRGTLNLNNHWAYRIPFAIQWFWPILLITGCYFAPESPWWLVRQNRLDDARAVVQRLISPQNVEFDIDKNIALMVVTTEHEREVNASTTYVACFRGINLRRTIIVIGCYCAQTLSGNSIRAQSTYFFQQAGLPTDQAFNMAIVGFALGLVGVIVTWFILPHVGRRTIYLWGLAGNFVLFMIVGGLGVPQAAHPTANIAWAIGALLLISVFVFDISVGPVAYSLVSEIPSSLLRSKSVVIARGSYTIANIVANVLVPYQLNPNAWGWSARAAFFWAGTTMVAYVFTYFYVPEPKDRTIAELDLLFEKKVPARHFAKTRVELAEVVQVETVKNEEVKNHV